MTRYLIANGVHFPIGWIDEATARRAHAAFEARYSAFPFERFMARRGFSPGELDEYAPGWVVEPLPYVDRVWYVGCVDESGHYCWTSFPDRPRQGVPFKGAQSPWGRGRPWEVAADGAELVDFLPQLRPTGTNSAYARDEQPERWCYDVRDGWTRLGTWDRSVDHRNGSYSVFVFRGEVSREEAEAVAADAFPRVWARLRNVPRNGLPPCSARAT